jgi:hypothetical protein
LGNILPGIPTLVQLEKFIAKISVRSTTPAISCTLIVRATAPKTVGDSLKTRLYKSITVLVSLVGFLITARAQETVRMSLASADAAAARRKAASTLGYYNLKIGPTAWRFGASLETEWNDNVQLREDAEDDFIFRPQLNTQMLWPITEQNALNLNLGVGYSFYVQHTELNRLFITPGSELSFDIYAGDFWINFHDRFSIIEDSYQDPTVTGTGGYSRLENALGMTATWDLNKIILRGGYDHVNYLGLTDNEGQPDGRSELAYLSGGYTFNPGLVGGIELGGGLLHYEGTNIAFANAKQWNAGAFLDTQVSDYIHFRGSAGYTDYLPEDPQTTNSVSDFSGIYAQLEFQHQLNEYVRYTLSGGRTITFAYYGGAVDLFYGHLIANWKVLRKIGLVTSLDYEHGTEGTFSQETFNRYGGSVSVSRPITAKSSASLRYQIYSRTSNLEGRDYLNNIVSLIFNYSF